MFKVVSNIEDYPLFVPWCIECNVLEYKDNDIIKAKMVVGFEAINISFPCLVTIKNSSIEVNPTLDWDYL